MRVKSISSLAIVLVAGAWSPARAQAPKAPAATRTVLQKHDLRAPGEEGVMALVEIPAGGREGQHTHPAETFVYVIEGTIAFDVEGKATAMYKAGDSFFIEPERIHEARNDGGSPARLVAVFVTDKGKPLTTPVK
ncbi:MAG TPA: cupin domain-containing protein [Anaeromyxobacteraceae bacterium]|nr:cupin domain-containing protein [Anaeromyxobacteraceae bacterium]